MTCILSNKVLVSSSNFLKFRSSKLEYDNAHIVRIYSQTALANYYTIYAPIIVKPHYNVKHQGHRGIVWDLT